jgi:hypothetical protein
MVISNPFRISCLMELPERLDARMNVPGAVEQFAADAGVTHAAVPENCRRHGDRSFGVVGGLADSPFALRISDVPRDARSRRSLESTDALRIPSKNAITGQCLGLLSDGIAVGDPVQAREKTLLYCEHGAFGRRAIPAASSRIRAVVLRGRFPKRGRRHDVVASSPGDTHESQRT